MPWFRAIDWFVSDRVRARGPDPVRRARLAVGSAAVTSLLLLWGGVYQGFWGVQQVGAAAAATGLGLAAVPFLIRASGSGALVGHGVPALLALFCVGVAFATGGRATGALALVPVVPLVAVLLGGLRSGALWGGLICVGLAGVVVAAGLGVAARWTAPSALDPIAGLRAAILAALGTFGLAGIYESLRGDALREVTEAHEAAAAAQQRRLESETRFRTLMENASDVICETDASGAFLYVNRQLHDQTGTRAEAMIGTHWLEHVGRVHREDLPRIQGSIATLLEHEQETDVAIRFRHEDGSWRWLESTFRPFRTAEGELHVVAVSRDVTERREVETLRRLTRELEETAGELARANRELEEFTALASHDLQEPLRKLVAFSELLRADLGPDLSEDAGRDLRFIEQGARRMHDLVRDLLTLSRAGVSEMKPERTPVDACLDSALERLALRIQETDAEIERDALPELRADPTLLTEIFQNLIGNALKFRTEAAPRIRVTAEQRRRRWTLGVCDNGIGVPAEESERIFQPFQRLAPARGPDGSGIGLAICRKAVERHGGRIWVESELGRGSHFRFTLGS